MRIVKAEQTFRRVRAAMALAALTLASLSAGCSADRILGTSSDQASSASASASSPSMTSRVAEFFSAKPQSVTPTSAESSEGAGPGCPPMDVRVGASTMTVPPGSADAFSLKYQGTIGEMARECKVSGGTMHMKVGIQGRVLVGPAGTAGKIDLPLRYAVVKEGPTPQTVASKYYKIPVTIADGQPNVPFVHIDENVSFPMPADQDIDAYVVYVGFDPTGDKAQPGKKPVAKPAPAPARIR
jgi:hypothetical protein